MGHRPFVWLLLPGVKRRLDAAIARNVQALHDLGDHTECGKDCPDAGRRTRPEPS